MAAWLLFIFPKVVRQFAGILSLPVEWIQKE